MLPHKNFLVLFLSLVLIFTFAETKSQTLNFEKNQNSMLVTFSTDVDSNEVVTSDWFQLSDLLAYSLYTYPIHFTKIQSSTLDKPHITTTIERSNDQVNIIVADTVGTVGDSLETLYNGTINLNDGKSWYYRIKQTGLTTNRSDAYIRTDLVIITPKQ